MPEDLDRAARDQRRAAEERHAPFFGGAHQLGDWKRNTRRRAASRPLLDELEDMALRRVLAAQRIASAGDPTFERRTVSLRHIVHVRAGPRILRSDETRELAFEVIRR